MARPDAGANGARAPRNSGPLALAVAVVAAWSVAAWCWLGPSPGGQGEIESVTGFVESSPDEVSYAADAPINEAREAAARKKKRDDFRAKKAAQGKLPFYDLMYAADPRKIQDTRWTASEISNPEENTGLQFNANWSASLTQGGGIQVLVQKWQHKPTPTTEGVFEDAGKKIKVADMGGTADYFFRQVQAGMSEVRKEKGKTQEPKKSSCGPADLFASVIGTSKESQKPSRVDLYFWLAPNLTYMARVTYSDKYLDDPAILAKGREFIGSIAELKGAPK